MPGSLKSFAQGFELFVAFTAHSAMALLHLARQYGISKPPCSFFWHNNARDSFSQPFPMKRKTIFDSSFSNEVGRGRTLPVYRTMGDICALTTVLLPISDKYLPFHKFSFPATLVITFSQFNFSISS